ncbi:hypothetical protein SCUCBS95973_008971 [Sporothrix curviconia]|uniref:Zn(2)-C6 fungal-type domain-containing protein n=1 Tax=Sporothrix curviconia TaxID=1260050 RepID=A0ABP0CRW9_9PEZI
MARNDTAHTVPLLIDGQEIRTKETFPVVSPVEGTGTVWDSSCVTQSDALAAAHGAQNAFPAWSKTKPAARRDILLHAADILAANAEEYEGYMMQETGAGAMFTKFNIKTSCEILRDCAGRISGALTGAMPCTEDADTQAMVVKEPYGVVLAIAPWNAPYILGIRSVVYALAAGNTCILKGSEVSPRCFWAIGKLFQKAGLPDGCLNVIYHRPADAANITKLLIEQPAIKKINFTGSTAVGRIIAETAGRNLKPVLMELGGKNNAIVREDANLAQAAQQCCLGSFLHAGQICMSTERILIRKHVFEAFKLELGMAMSTMFGDSAPAQPLALAAGTGKVVHLAQDALSHGAAIVHGEAPSSSSSGVLRPFALEGVTKGMHIYHTESFGPCVSLVSVDSDDEAVRIANDTEYGLSGAIFTKDLAKGLSMARQIETGAVHINGMSVHDEAGLPHDDREGTRQNKNHVVHSRRVSQACKYCAAAKIKCDDKKPCNGCVQRGMTCEYNVEMHEHARSLLSSITGQRDTEADDSGSAAGPLSGALSDTGATENTDATEITENTESTDMTMVAADPSLPMPERGPPETPLPLSLSNPTSAPLDASVPMATFMPHGHNITDFLKDVMTMPSTPLNLMHVDNTDGPHGLLDFTVDMDLDLNDTDFGFFDKLYSNSFDGIPQPQQLFSMDPAVMAQQQRTPVRQHSPPPYPVQATRYTIEDVSTLPLMRCPPPQQTEQLQPGQPVTGNPMPPPRAEKKVPGMTTTTTTTTTMTATVSTTRQQVALGAEAFRRSAFGVWLPARQDCGDAELENLSVLSPEVASPDTRISLDRHFLREKLGRTTRDEFLAMILSTCRPDKIPLVVRTFPTSGLLDDLLECFFAYHQQQVDCFVHAASFQPNEQRCELVALLIATGATKTNIKALHKLGFGIQAALRTIIPQRCEGANANTRKLWLLQSFMSELQIGMWSGIKRKMELAESHISIIFTMLRRAGRFQDTKRSVAEPLFDDTGDVLHRKWLDWIEQESFKRLAFHVFVCDAQISMTMLTNPHISYAELSIPFPDSRDLWMAETAEQWKVLYLARTPVQGPRLCLLDFLQQPDDIPDFYDTFLSGLVVLAGIWGMVWQHLQLSAVLHRHGEVSSKNQSMVALSSLRREELLRTLLHFRANFSAAPGQEPASAETALMLEVVSMYLFVNFGDLQLFAGKGDIDDARRILPSLQKWVATEDARKAVWHAGQALRAAAAFPAKQLDRFYAVAVYHAGLTLWAYSVIRQARAGSGDKGHPGTASCQQVCLDGVESSALAAFFTLGRLAPVVGSCRQGMDPVPLSNPQAVMGVVLETLRGNFPAAMRGEGMPPLVDNLVQLLRDLGQAARNVEG